MAKKKKSQSAQAENQESIGGAGGQSLPSRPAISPTIPAVPAQRASQTTKTAPQPAASSPALIICRNKHWRYISSFHGPWLHLPPEILDTLANMNYNTPRPRPIDPAVFFDLVKVRKLVDEATDQAVKAASGVASSSLNNANSTYPVSALGLGLGGGTPAKLSKERKHRMREQATQKLSRAYHLDEIACSVATMQSASLLEDVASLVLQRNQDDPDAKYVHFFHEKIPSRHLAECTSLVPLDQIIRDKPAQGEPLRTRATVKVFKEDFEGAAQDLTSALQVHRFFKQSHFTPTTQSSQALQTYETAQHRGGWRQEDIVLKEEEQPSSLEIQLLFQRAGVYLAMACQQVNNALQGGSVAPDQSSENVSVNGAGQDAEDMPVPELTPAEQERKRKAHEAAKSLKQNAKRALRDYMAYLSHFDYSPDYPIELAEDFARKVNVAHNTRLRKNYGRSDSPISKDETPNPPHRIYSLSELFTATPPADLPPYPVTDLAPRSRQPQAVPIQTTEETLTYHPLLSDALHSLLLCHCLIQTSAKEMLRHAYMVARLARLADGYPVFQASRSPARTDWMEILRKSDNWIQIVGSWEALCAPAPLPLFQSESVPEIGTGGSGKNGNKMTTYSAPSRPVNGSGSNGSWEVVEAERRDSMILDAISDERVHDRASFNLALRARQARAERDYRLDNAVAALDAKLSRRELEAGEAASGTATPKTTEGISTPTETDDGDSKAEPEPEQEAPPKENGITSPVTNDPKTNGTSTEVNTAKPNTNGAVAADPTNGIAQGSSIIPPRTIANIAPTTRKASSSSSTVAKNGTHAGPLFAPASPAGRRWAVDDGREYPIMTERAAAVAQWVREAPPNAGSAGTGPDGVRKRKKKPVKKAAGAGASVDAGVAAGPDVVKEQ